MNTLKGLTANCKEASLLSLKKEEGKLSFAKRLKLLLHLAYCASCRNFVKQSSIITAIAARHREGLTNSPMHKLSSETKDAIQKKINESI